MYYTLHEADITKFVDIVDSKIKEYFPETNLKRIADDSSVFLCAYSFRGGGEPSALCVQIQRRWKLNPERCIA